ncbi:head-tail connector protein [Sphingomonas sp. RB3P16]|uniref:head-tail connector protein n=1 Tax=Parasphingomonas frigoris TaxID=3096163 RepID=UPI002FC8CBFE
MRTFVVVPPEPVVTWAEADDHLKLEGDEDQKSMVEAMIAAATGMIDGPTGWLGRAVGVQTLEARFDHFGCGVVRLRYPPIVDVTSVKVISETGSELTIANDLYEQLGEKLVPAFDASWPVPQFQREAVRIRYRAGYETLPGQIRAAILLMVGDLYRFRESAASGQIGEVPMSTTVERLLAPLRVWM